MSARMPISFRTTRLGPDASAHRSVIETAEGDKQLPDLLERAFPSPRPNRGQGKAGRAAAQVNEGETTLTVRAIR